MKPINHEKYWGRGSMKALWELKIFGVKTVFDRNFDKRHFEICHNKPFLYNFFNIIFLPRKTMAQHFWKHLKKIKTYF